MHSGHMSIVLKVRGHSLSPELGQYLEDLEKSSVVDHLSQGDHEDAEGKQEFQGHRSQH